MSGRNPDKERFTCPWPLADHPRWRWGYEGHEIEEHHRDEAAAYAALGKEHILLWQLPTPVLLVPAATSVVYENQVWGHACAQMNLEGYLMPLSTLDESPTVFCPPDTASWGSRVYSHGTPEQLAEVERQLNEGGNWCCALNIRVIEDEDNGEAWLWVEFDPYPVGERRRAVLTWSNSD